VALKPWWMLAVVAMAVSCGGSPPPEADADEAAALSVTRWTDQTELFAEYPTLVVGQTSRFAIHLTRLDRFKALTEGRVTVTLRGGSAGPETFAVEGPSRPGIFGVDVRPSEPGRRELVIAVQSGALKDEHRVGEVEVYRDPAAAKAAPVAEEASADGITFLKEQQWTLEFETAVITEGTLRESIAVPATVEARPDGAADVVAPIDGRLTHVAAVAIGSAVSSGQELARLLPPAAGASDLPQLQRARSEAQTAFGLATRDRERAERLTNAGAAPEKRLDDARAAEAQARMRLTAAEASLEQFEAVRVGGEAAPGGMFIVRAPLSGVIAARSAVAGANVGAGAPLFRVVDATAVHVTGQVPETDALRVTAATGAELELAGRSDRLVVGPRVALGKVLNPSGRTLPITFALDNTRLSLPVGQAGTLHILLAPTSPGPVVPASALVDDAGRPIVFVQRAGETFERRPVTVGARSGNLVRVLHGIKPGERVVTTGAYLVRLAALSTTVPAHGHVH
jgi:cobalt-zinc-cadmium efflux system membrane fusion protein